MKIEFTVRKNPLLQPLEYLKEIEINYSKLSIEHVLGNTIIAEGDIKYLAGFIDLVNDYFGIISTHIVPISSKEDTSATQYNNDANVCDSSLEKPDVKDVKKPLSYEEGISNIITPILTSLNKKDILKKNISEFLSKCGIENPPSLLNDIFMISVDMNKKEINYNSLKDIINENNNNNKILSFNVKRCLKNMFDIFYEKHKDMEIFQYYQRCYPLIIVKLFSEYFQK